MEKIADGGSAFPVTGKVHAGYGGESCGGMSLRDFFAAHALAGLMGTPEVRDADPDGAVGWLAKKSYEIADAMLAQRSKVKP